MPPQIDRRPFVRSANSKGPVESPPPIAVISDHDIVRRGCPGAPKKEPPSGSRKRYRPSVFLAIGDDEKDDDEQAESPLPRQLFPHSVDGLPKPTAIRVHHPLSVSPTPSMSPNKKMLPRSSPDALLSKLG